MKTAKFSKMKKKIEESIVDWLSLMIDLVSDIWIRKYYHFKVQA